MSKIMSPIKKYSGTVALIVGGISAMGFAPLGLWPISLASFAILIYLLIHAESAKNSFRLGWLWGLGHFTITLQWLAFSFTFQDTMPVWLGYFAVLAVSLYFAIYPAIAAASVRWLCTKLGLETSRNSGAVVFIILFSATWILSEWLRSIVFTGSGWNPISASMIDTILADFLPWIGSYGVSGLVIVVAGILMNTITMAYKEASNNNSVDRLPAIYKRLMIPFLLLCFFAVFNSYGKPSSIVDKESDLDITIVQPNISQADKYRAGYNQINYQKLSELSLPLEGQENRPRIILWPEAAIPDYLEGGYPQRAYYDTIGGSAENALATLGTLMGPNDILLTGGTRLEFENNALLGARNSVMALRKNAANDSAELFATYDKAHLLPFGEYLPLRSILEPIGLARLVPGDIDFWPGDGPDSITIASDHPEFGGVKIGIQICYELVFSGRIIDRDNRPDFIFSPSNDAWFGPWGPHQHEAQGRLRAIEEGITILRVTPTGVSSEIYSNGEIFERVEAGVAGRLDLTLPHPNAPTFFSKHGNSIPITLALLILFLTSISTIAIRRARR